MNDQRTRGLLNIYNQKTRIKVQKARAIIPTKCYESLAQFSDSNQFLDSKSID